jgi:translation initiation factor IF-3
MRLAEDVEDLGTIEQRPSLDGRNMTMVMNPLKAKERKPEPNKKSKGKRAEPAAEEPAAEEPVAEEQAKEEAPAQEPAPADAG